MQLSTDELKAKSIEPSTLDFAIQQIKINGYVVLESVISPDLISELGAYFNQILKHNVATKEANRGKNRYQMHLPFRNYPNITLKTSNISSETSNIITKYLEYTSKIH